MSDQQSIQRQLDNQEGTLTDLSKLLDTTVAAMIPAVKLDGRFRNDHRFVMHRCSISLSAAGRVVTSWAQPSSLFFLAPGHPCS
jgi:hypothetical protein